MTYTRTTWQDAPATATPITAARLNNIEGELVALPSTYVAKADSDIYVDADYTGATDSAAILQAACDLGSSTGRRVVMGAGTIRLDTSITPASRLHLVGQGPGQTIIQTPTNAAAFYRYANGVQTNMTFENFEIDGSRHTGAWNVGMKGLYFTHAFRVHLTRLYVHDCGATGIGIDHVTGTITNCHVHSCGRLGTPSSPGSSGIGIGVGGLAAWEPLTISGCHTVSNKRYGIFVESQVGSFLAAGVTVMGCTATLNRDGFGDAGTTGTRWVNNHAYDNDEAGFAIDSGSYSAGTPGHRTSILGNYAAANKYGILLTGSTVDHNLTAARVADNTVMGNSDDGIRVNVISPAACSRVVIQDNSIYDNAGYGLHVIGSANYDRVAILGNSFDTNTLGDLLVDATTTDLLATSNDIRDSGGTVSVPPGGTPITTGNFGTLTVSALSVTEVDSVSSDLELIKYTFTDVDFGAEATDRTIVAVVGTRATRSVQSVTIGGVSATADAFSHVSAEEGTWVYRADVPSGLTGTIVVAFGPDNETTFLPTRCNVAVVAVTGGGTVTPSDTATGTGSGTAMTVTVPAGGFTIAGATAYATAHSDCTWTTLAERATVVADGIIYTSVASSTVGSGDITATATWSLVSGVPHAAMVTYATAP